MPWMALLDGLVAVGSAAARLAPVAKFLAQTVDIFC
ncbi:hypothetical protein PIN31009_00131 [Pandoraea iniqua]|uniref:Uncharacterized protein n=1 Tax=Pandoraea iniqua TaxID=2508288 RepID=A0A5E4RU57_9BURK|nr:hypothetical protein PIN31009_00131 [Pandoraea iniqua]VVD65962.1 hypothetical protein PIN31115_00338 [Pandoraea iniqua]